MDQSRHLRYAVLIYFILLSLVSVCPTSADSVLPTTESVNSTLRIANMSFSQRLSNPCSLTNPSSLTREYFKRRNLTFEASMAVNARYKAREVKEKAQAVIDSHILPDCGNLTLPPVAVIPTAENHTLYAMLNLFYSSILNHTAHIYLISENVQPHSYDSSCSSLRDKTEDLATGVKFLLCELRYLIVVTPNDTDDDFKTPLDKILNEEFTQQRICSRRLFQDCQTVRSTVSLMTAFLNFLQRTFFESTTVYYQTTTVHFDETSLLL